MILLLFVVTLVKIWLTKFVLSLSRDFFRLKKRFRNITHDCLEIYTSSCELLVLHVKKTITIKSMYFIRMVEMYISVKRFSFNHLDL